MSATLVFRKRLNNANKQQELYDIPALKHAAVWKAHSSF